MKINLRQLNGTVEEVEVNPDATVRDFKRQLKELQGCDDMTRELMVVDLFYNLEQLNDQKTLAEAGISAGAEVQILFGTMAPVECPNRKSAGVEELVVVKIPDSVTWIQDGAFRGCKSLVKVDIPNSVTSIGDYAFSDCSSLRRLTIPSSVAFVGHRAFENCSSLVEVQFSNPAESSMTSIKAGAFNNCQSLVQFTIPNSVTSIGCGAFSCCHSLAEMIIPNSVAHIGDLAFENCSSLEQVTIPESITCIGEDVFAGTRISTSQEAEVNQASCGKKSGAQGKKTCS
ncbi:unnamed protein product [Durusdinium trenchii]|uniref:Ubiquitin-like domain-containing protein n=1 Tax=Durusdinium trenchii TaxID=1381693 RepID=A0ABP0SAG8_9DINO